MSSYTTYAVAGAGGVGTPIIANLVSLKKTVIVLSRSSDLKIEGAETKAVDYDTPSTLEAALEAVDVVICALAYLSGDAQETLAIAAKKVGVKLFVPNEYGDPSTGRTGEDTHPLLRKKALFQEYLKKIDLPYVLTFTGPFTDMVLAMSPEAGTGIDFKNGKLAFVGKGETQITWTTRIDIGYYLAHALVETPDDKLAWSTLRLQGDSKSFNDIIDLWESKVNPGSKLEVTRIPVDEALEKIKTSVGFESAFTFILLSWEQGHTIYKVPSDSKRWPEYRPTTVEDVLKTFL